MSTRYNDGVDRNAHLLGAAVGRRNGSVSKSNFRPPERTSVQLRGQHVELSFSTRIARIKGRPSVHGVSASCSPLGRQLYRKISAVISQLGCSKRSSSRAQRELSNDSQSPLSLARPMPDSAGTGHRSFPVCRFRQRSISVRMRGRDPEGIRAETGTMERIERDLHWQRRIGRT